MKGVKRSYRMFSIANPERLEAYLEGMGEKGWHLNKLAIKAGIFTFSKAQPTQSLYCLRNRFERPIQDIKELESEGWRILDVGHDWRILCHTAVQGVQKPPRDAEFLAKWLNTASNINLIIMGLFGLLIILFAAQIPIGLGLNLPFLTIIDLTLIVISAAMLIYLAAQQKQISRLKKINHSAVQVRHVFHFLPVWNEQAMDDYLNQQSTQGWQLIRANFLMNSLTFTKGAPCEYRYCVRNRKGTALKNVDAISQAGWGILYYSPIIFGWHVFRSDSEKNTKAIPIDRTASTKYFVLLLALLLAPFVFTALLTLVILFTLTALLL